MEYSATFKVGKHPARKTWVVTVATGETVCIDADADMPVEDVLRDVRQAALEQLGIRNMPCPECGERVDGKSFTRILKTETVQYHISCWRRLLE
ncbi:MAG: hypothetical protein MPK62_01560 [Alphaproteobacteria bacterium]|nr:hypothetical protein [Alphaproteobacteria bacterium]MDA8029821.1 hypothetical protein [Alphaproteobacteria bacterium]